MSKPEDHPVLMSEASVGDSIKLLINTLELQF